VRTTKEQRRITAQFYFNRGVARYLADADAEAAIVDIKRALELRPDYSQARQALRELERDASLAGRQRRRWLPW
jgi:tetratricopeptide (TPR) repeat protein